MPNFANALNTAQVLQSLDADQLGYVNTMLAGASFSKYVQIVPPKKFKKDEYYERKQKAESVVQKRLLNQNPDPKHVNNYEKIEEPTVQVGGAVEIDYKLLAYKPNELDRRINDFLFDMGLALDYMAFNGDQTNGDFVGLKNRVPSDLIFDNGGSTLQINASVANFLTLCSLFRKLKRRLKGGPGATLVAWMNDTVYEGIQAGAKLAGANFLGNKVVDLLNDEFVTLESVPLLPVMQDDAGNDILPQTEGGGTEGSIYLTYLGGAPADGSQEIPNGVVFLSEGGVSQTPQIDGNIRRVTLDYEAGLRVPHRTLGRIRKLTVA